jgi:AraC-like DNA-binding protein/quercetin dioxygenase-like cupin family protein
MIVRLGQILDGDASCNTVVVLSEDAGRLATAVDLDFADYEAEMPRHQHRQGQLILALHGAVTCTANNGLWIVPPTCGIWIPGGVPHSNHPTSNARLAYLFVEPGAAVLPDGCCTLSISPMIREMILRLADEPTTPTSDDHPNRLASVLLEELSRMPASGLMLPTSTHPKVALVTSELAAAPADRRPLLQWAKRVGMSERSFKRLMVQETGLSFGRWRQQLHLLVALRELASGASVQHVSGVLGYESPTAFIVMFKKAMGVTPSRYMAQ